VKKAVTRYPRVDEKHHQYRYQQGEVDNQRTQKGKALFAQVEPVDVTEDEREALEEQLLDIKPSQKPTA
jgi:polyhydroxyalkanoate synthesis regulator phasin